MSGTLGKPSRLTQPFEEVKRDALPTGRARRGALLAAGAADLDQNKLNSSPNNSSPSSAPVTDDDGSIALTYPSAIAASSVRAFLLRNNGISYGDFRDQGALGAKSSL